MKILIVGASGLVGAHCFSFLRSTNLTVKGTHLHFSTEDTVQYDPLDEQNELLDIYQPDVIVHCGALTNVDYCEQHQEESYQLTVASAGRLADWCQLHGKKMVYISTDYVFDGNAGPYRESDGERPLNVYGIHKQMAEQAVKQLSQYLILRVTNVYGEEVRGKNFIARLIQWLQQNEEKKLQLPYDQFATPVYAGDIARMLYLLLRDGKNGVYHLASNDFYNRYQLAQKVAAYFPQNTSVIIIPVSTAALQQAAARPLCGGLLNIKFTLEYPEFVYTNADQFLAKLITHGV